MVEPPFLVSIEGKIRTKALIYKDVARLHSTPTIQSHCSSGTLLMLSAYYLLMVEEEFSLYPYNDTLFSPQSHAVFYVRDRHDDYRVAPR